MHADIIQENNLMWGSLTIRRTWQRHSQDET